MMRGDWAGAAAAWAALGCPYEEALARLDGDDDSVVAALRSLDRLGAAPLARRTRAVLRGRGLTAPRAAHVATRAHPLGLTAREAEVHELLLAGLSNPDIARRLVISRRTVEHHVSAVLAKAGAGTRAEIGEVAPRSG